MSLNRNSTSYVVNLRAQIMRVFEEYKRVDKPILMPHQYIIREMYTNPIFGLGKPENTRGLMIFHATGTGKTLVAVSILLALLDLRQPIILLAKGLQKNFLENIDKLVNERNLADNIKSRINFISLDAFNSAVQMKSKAGTLDGKLLIVDEAHNLFKAIINSGEGDTNAKTLFKMIMDAVDLRIVFLSATPITKDPFELVCCMNMLTGNELLPSNYETFTNSYIDRTEIKNKDLLQNRLYGLVSFVRFDLPMYPGDIEKTLEETGRPKDLGIKVEKVEMSEEQYLRYISIRDKEEKVDMRRKRGKSQFEGVRNTPNMSIPKSGKGGSSYHIESRMISNFSVPLEFMKTDVSTLDKSFFTKDNSPKIFRLVQNIKRGHKPCLVYSQFITGGLGVIEKFLELEKFTKWSVNEYGQVISHKLRFATISGKVNMEERNMIVETFNKAANMYGDVIAVLLVSETGAEGLDLKHIRSVHILEPYWDISRIKQIQGRAIRKGSHMNLPETDRDVQTIIYTSVPNKKIEEISTFKEKDSIDMQFLTRANRRMALIKRFEELLMSVSIECTTNDYGNCRVCLPDNVPLFNTTNVRGDLEIDNNPCKPFDNNVKIKATKIKYNNEIYYYREDKNSPLNYTLYTYDEKLDGYVQFPLNNPVALQIIKTLK